MELSTPHLQLMIMALWDAIRAGQQKLQGMSEDEMTDQEEYLVRLGILEGELYWEYERRGKAGEKNVPYEDLTGRPRFRKL